MYNKLLMVESRLMGIWMITVKSFNFPVCLNIFHNKMLGENHNESALYVNRQTNMKKID